MRIASGEVQLASGESSRITTRHTSSRGAILLVGQNPVAGHVGGAHWHRGVVSA